MNVPRNAHVNSVPVTPVSANPVPVTPVPDPEYLETADRQLAVRRTSGSGGPTLVAVHGLGGSSLNWLPLMQELAGEVDVVALDLPGFGESPPPRDGDYSPSGHARAVAAVIADLGRPVHVIGNSLGGAVSVQLAARWPSAVESLTLISPALPTRRVGRGSAHLPVIAIPGVGESLVGRYAQMAAELRMQSTIDACFADQARLPTYLRSALLAEVYQRDALPYAHDAFLSSLRGLMATFLDPGPRRPWRLAAQVSSPVLALYGEDDVLVDARGAMKAARTFPRAEVVVVPDCGHVAQMEHPALVADLWRTSVGGLRVSSGI